jgi:hypothetical protein
MNEREERGFMLLLQGPSTLVPSATYLETTNDSSESSKLRRSLWNQRIFGLASLLKLRHV